MHIPDNGMMSAKVLGVMGAISAVGLGAALRHAKLHLPPRRIPLLGLAAAFVFAAQMLNFPVGGGTSGHLMGGVLVAALLGPSGAVIVMSAVLIVQALLFSDGGILALGANIFNMGLVGGVGGWLIYTPLARGLGGLRGKLVAAAFAGWCTIVLAAVACSAQLAASGAVRWSIVFPTMTGVHMVIGIGEGVITALVLASIARTRPELLDTDGATPAAAPAGVRHRELAVYGVLISLGLAVFASPLASSMPDGLEHATEKLKIEAGESKPVVPALAPDYEMRGVSSRVVATSIAGAIGTAVAFGLALALGRTLARKAEDRG